SSAPATLSTGSPAAVAGGNVGTSAQFGHGCTNCYAVPRGTGHNWTPGASGIGPTAPFSGSTLNWSSFNDSANLATNGLRNQFDPLRYCWVRGGQGADRRPLSRRSAPYQHLLFLWLGLLQQPPRQISEPVEFGSGGKQCALRRRGAKPQSVLSGRGRSHQS